MCHLANAIFSALQALVCIKHVYGHKDNKDILKIKKRNCMEQLLTFLIVIKCKEICRFIKVKRLNPKIFPSSNYILFLDNQ